MSEFILFHVLNYLIYVLEFSIFIFLRFFSTNNYANFGYVLVSDVCELGQFYDTSSQACVDCAFGSYQDELYELSCIPCSANHWTFQTKSVLGDRCSCKLNISLHKIVNFLDSPRLTHKNNLLKW